ncbi:MAG: hypothetical protein C0447_18665 [Methylobacterium sp.]|nr:hypothetical protein [Methylobacterium sp.]
MPTIHVSRYRGLSSRRGCSAQAEHGEASFLNDRKRLPPSPARVRFNRPSSAPAPECGAGPGSSRRSR